MKFIFLLVGVLVSALIGNIIADDQNNLLRSEIEVNIDDVEESEDSGEELDNTYSSFCGWKAAPCDPDSKYSRLDGSCNNLDYPEWGLPNATYASLLPPDYGDGIALPRIAYDKSSLPDARKLRLALLPTGSKVDAIRSLLAMQWGQFVAHDMSLQQDPSDNRCCDEKAQYQDNLSGYCFPIKIEPSDPVLGATMRCMNFSRTVSDKDIGCSLSASAPARKINAVTPWMDLSLVYDTNPTKGAELRTGVNGLLKTVARGGSAFPPQDLSTADESCKCNRANETICYLGGDTRINQSPHLTVLQILLLREHNRLASELQKINPHWNDEKLFQEARRINIAQHQHISYYEWMPTILGYKNLVRERIIFPSSKSYVNDYDSSLSPDVFNEHAHGAFRHFHSQIAEMLRIMDANGKTQSSINIANFIHRPSVLETKNNFAGLVKGMLIQNAERIDTINNPSLSNRMLACTADDFGFDLRSFDIQRDRDHGIRNYNDYRSFCGLKEAECFDDYSDYISRDDIKKLKSLYKNYLDVDLTIGGALERKVLGSEVGPTFMCILVEQFRKTRQADRFWFEHEEAGFTLAQLKEIRRSSMSRLFCNNEKSVKKVYRNSFYSSDAYDLIPCSAIPVVDLQKWKE